MAMVARTLTVAVLAVAIGAWLALFQRDIHSPGPIELLDQLRRVRNRVAPRGGSARVALGVNVCIDAIVDVFELFDDAKIRPPKSRKDLPAIHSLEDLASTFMYYFSKAGASERTVANVEAFKTLEESLYKTKHRSILGGNAAIMAVVLAEDYGFEQIVLGGQAGPVVSKLIPQNIKTVGLASGATYIGGEMVTVRQDEVHLIMEYQKGASWGEGTNLARATRANRFIVTHDHSNAVLASFEPLIDRVVSDDTPFDLLVVAGFHMLDSRDPEFQAKRIRDIMQQLSKVPSETRVHFELASIGDEHLLVGLATTVLPLVDSLGLNEEELAAVYNALDLDSGEEEKLDMEAVSRQVPDAQVVTKALERLLKRFGGNSDETTRALSRIHFHSFAFHVVAQTRNAEELWPNQREGVSAGSIKASERACATKDLSDELIALHMPLTFVVSDGSTKSTTASVVSEWTSKDGLVKFALVPVLACNNAVQTVGLGDSISASALAFQV